MQTLVLISILAIESFFMLGLRTDVVHRDDFYWANKWKSKYDAVKDLTGYEVVVESANMHPSENLKILASNDARMTGYKRIQTIRKDMTYLLVYERETA